MINLIQSKNRLKINWLQVLYDIIVYCICCFTCYFFPSAFRNGDLQDIVLQSAIMLAIILCVRFLFKVYYRIWRYEGAAGYLSLMFADIIALIVFLLLQIVLPIPTTLSFVYVSIGLSNLLFCLFIRILYRYIFKYGSRSKIFPLYRILMKVISFGHIELHEHVKKNRIKIAIIGAGRTGQSLAYDLESNPAAYYKPLLFVDNDKRKIGKTINDLPVYSENKNIFQMFKNLGIKEVVIAVPDLPDEDKSRLYEFYKESDCKVKVYDFPVTTNANGRPTMRDFDIEDLMPRKPILLRDNNLSEFYQNKSVLITGGGGSIGSEIARQVYFMNCSKLILLDIYENGAYDVQQELLSSSVDSSFGEIFVEICSVVDRDSLERVFDKYRPDIVIHAAAHKHVPLMENNCIEAIKNNIVGTKNVIDVSEKYNVCKFMMVSSDKAVNPTNVMGATKRFCEMLVEYASVNGKVRYGSTRFGNVLGSAGSVVPLFKRQIANGGPVTITDRRIIRYFMTIPEACNLVLEASLLTKNGELFVLDMGSPVKIVDLAQNMIDISGAEGVEIVETGLRPGEKLYEELLIDYGKHDKTDNDLIFIERNSKIPDNLDVNIMYNQLLVAIDLGDEKNAKSVLKEAVPEYKSPDEVNSLVCDSKAVSK